MSAEKNITLLVNGEEKSLPLEPGWRDLHYPDEHPLHPQSIDLAFVITGPIPGDANGDGKVDGSDLAIWQQNYDPLGTVANTFEMGDWNCDGKIDGSDLAIWQQNYDPLGVTAGPVAAVPEPASLALMAVGGVLMFIRQRRRS